MSKLRAVLEEIEALERDHNLIGGKMCVCLPPGQDSDLTPLEQAEYTLATTKKMVDILSRIDDLPRISMLEEDRPC